MFTVTIFFVDMYKDTELVKKLKLIKYYILKALVEINWKFFINRIDSRNIKYCSPTIRLQCV